MTDSSRLDEALAAAPTAISGAATLAELDAVEGALLGSTSAVGEARSSMGSLDPADRPRVGAQLNAATKEIQGLLASRLSELEAQDEEGRLEDEKIDVTLESITLHSGSLHLLQQTMDEIVDIFVSLGYQVATGPEAELAWYNFDRPRGHTRTRG